MKNRLSKSKAGFFALLTLFAVALFSCNNDDNLNNQTSSDWFGILPAGQDFSSFGGTKSVLLVSEETLDTNALSYQVSANSLDWCSVALSGNNLNITVAPNPVEIPRSSVITLEYGECVRQIPVNQASAMGDRLIEITGGTATSEETDDNLPLSNSYDGNTLSYFNSKYGAISSWPFQITYNLKDGYTLDRIIYYPRSDSGNKWGSFNEYEVWVSTSDAPTTFKKVGEYERGDANHNVTIMRLEEPISNVAKVRFDIYSAYSNRISCAEMEFIQKGNAVYDYSSIFADDVFSTLKEGVTKDQIKAISDSIIRNLALDLFVGEYDTEFRVGSFRPYQKPAIQSAINKTSPYSLRDNPTGIYVEEGDELLIIADDLKDQHVSIAVQNLNNGYNSKNYAIQEGENRLIMGGSGLIYVQNLTDDAIPLILESEADKAAAEAKTVNLHFVNGKINGYFDLTKHDAEDWTRILANAAYQDMDIFGQYAHITWTTQNFRSYNTDAVSVVTKYDRLVYLEQEFAGLEKYDKMFKNRMYLHIDYAGSSPYATNNRTAYTSSYAELFCNADRFEARIWGPGHELGHINQLRPALKWAGTTEVTNNLMSLYVQTQFGEMSKLLADGIYEEARTAIIEADKPHCLENASNQFYIKSVVFWQLKLYMVDALGKTDFYKDLYEHFRVTDDLNTSTTTQGILQLDFVRQVCRISGLNMIDFFTKWGFLTPVDTSLEDYGAKPFRITQAQIDDLITEINNAGYDMPAHTNIEFIQDDNIEDYK